MNKIIVEVSVGELLDKISILEIKQDKIKDPEKLNFINNEHSILKNQLEKNVKSDEKLEKLFQDLKEINAKLWVIEDNKRECEKNKDFGDKFIKLSRDVHFLNDDSAFMDLPPSKEFEKNILIPELSLGDAVLFNFKTVHGSTGNNSSKSRRAFSMRFIGDDVKYIDRGGPTSPPFDGINLKTGDLMRDDWFPKVFSS